MKAWAVLAGMALTCTCAAFARADRGVDTTSADHHPIVPAVRAAAPPVVDGVLDDPIWASAPRLDGFQRLSTSPVALPYTQHGRYDPATDVVVTTRDGDVTFETTK